MPAPPTVLVIGGGGQVGHEVAAALAAFARPVAPSRRELDLLDPSSIVAALDAFRPAVVVNAAAYTAVDRAESEQRAAARVNADGAGALAAACADAGAALVHLSTDYVFDGTARSPYSEGAAARPLNVYGRTKLAGERAVEAVGGAYLIFRTGWVYGPRRSNFARTIRRLSREREELGVVNDQVGAPTSAAALAAGLASVIRALADDANPYAAAEAAAGTYHMSAAGQTTWFGFARAILAADPHSAASRCRALRPITSAEFGAPAPRPAYSVLDNSRVYSSFGVRLAPWEEEWERMSAAVWDAP